MVIHSIYYTSQASEHVLTFPIICSALDPSPPPPLVVIVVDPPLAPQEARVAVAEASGAAAEIIESALPCDSFEPGVTAFFEARSVTL